jgi:outer membrane protein assembly factor BamB
VKLEGVIPWREAGRDYVWLALERKGGRITGVSIHAMKTYNKIAHPVDRSGLTITDSAIRGTLSAVFVPDRYVPTDLSYVRVQTTIDATIGKDGSVEGKHAGRWDLPDGFTGKATCRVLPGSRWSRIVRLDGHGWPQFLGPTGANFISSPLGEGVALVSDLNEARLVWVSDERRIGAGKSGTDPYWLSEPSEGFASPIVHRGKVFVVHFKGRGPAWDRSERGTNDPARKHYHYIDADDIVVAIDAATGRTVWKQVFEGQGINRPVGKRGGFAITPVGHGDRLYATTTTGLVYAFEADTGEVLWQSPLPLHEQIMQAKAEGLSKHALVTRGACHGPMAVIGGVLVASDLGDGLVGFDLDSGRRLWHRSKVKYSKAAPTTFVEGGRQYILVARAHPDGTVRLIDPESGGDLWTLGDLAPCHVTLPTDVEHTIAFVPSRDGRQKVLVGLKISTKGAEKLWEMPEEYRTETSGDAAPAPVYTIRDGVLTGRVQRRDGKRRFFVRMSDGKVLAEAPGSYGAGLHYGDTYVISPDPFHTPGLSEELVPIATKDNFREGGRFIRRHRQSGGYSVPQIRPFVNGFMFVRTGEGFVACYDLRANRR